MNDKAFASPSLPVELIVEIGRQTLRLADKKSLRLTCSFLGIEFKPHVLSTVTLDIYLGNTDCGLGLLETLVEDSKSEQSTVCKYIRTLYVDSLSPSTEPLVSKSDVTLKNKEPKPRINFWSRSKSVSDSETAEKRLRLLLEPALKALHNLDTLRWHWELQDSEWAYHTILASISTSALSKNIKEFGFRHDGSFSTAIGALTLPNLPQLRKLSLDGNTISQVTFNDVLSNYELETLHIFRHGSYFSLTDRCLPTSIADLGLDGWYIDVPRIIHNNLTSLYLGDIIEYDNSASDDAYYFTREDAFNSLWDSLRLEHVQLRNLAAPFRITDALLDYITSYSGLESLSLISYRDWYVDGDNASRFYKRALPMHRSTLTKLELTPEHEDEWCFGTENVEVFSLMKRLRYLSVGIHTRGLDPDPLELPGHSIYHKDGNFPNLVHLLLRMISSSLPDLEKVTISKAAEFVNTNWGNLTKYNQGINRRLHASVKSFAQQTHQCSSWSDGPGSDVLRWVKVYVENERVVVDDSQEHKNRRKKRKWDLPMLQRFTKRLSAE